MGNFLLKDYYVFHSRIYYSFISNFLCLNQFTAHTGTGLNVVFKKIVLMTVINISIIKITCYEKDLFDSNNGFWTYYGIMRCYGSSGAETVKVEHKKGWSHRKKYGIIGAGAGAATGALISKHHARGAVIGGVVGGASGYLLGRHKDKKYPYRRTYKTKKTVH